MDSITICHTGFIICLAGSILFFVISVVLFFIFDIKTIFAIRSGRAQAKTIKEMQEANSSTGRLKIGKSTQTSSLKKKKPVQQPVKRTAPAGINVLQVAEQDASSVTEDVSLTGDRLKDQEFGQTEALDDIASETTVLSSELSSSANSADSGTVHRYVDVHFEIVKKIVCRDTNEIVS